MGAIPEERISETYDDYIKNFLEDAAAYCAAASERAATSLYAAEGYGKTKDSGSNDVLSDSRTENSFSLDSNPLAVASSFFKSRVAAPQASSLAGRLIKRTKQSVSSSAPVKELDLIEPLELDLI